LEDFVNDAAQQPTPEQWSARLAAAVANSDDAIFSVSPTGEITSWNQAAARLYGATAEAVLGTSPASLAAPHRQADLRAILDRALAGEHISRHETEHLRTDGLALVVSLTALPVVVDGAIVEASVIVRDVTEQRFDEATLVESETRRREIEQLAEIGSWTWDAPSGVVQWSAGLHAIAKVDPKDFDGTLAGHLDAVHIGDRAAVAAAMHRALDEESSFEESFRIERPSGEERWIVGRAEPVRSADRVVALRGIFQDVTATRAAERLKDQFLATISHELRTPVAVIVGFADVLAAASATEMADVVDAIVRNAAEMEHMVGRLLDFSRLEADRDHIELGVIDARDVIETSLEIARYTTHGRQVANLVEPGHAVRCDRESVHRIIDNLVGNATKYSAPGSSIEVSARVDGDWLVLAVSDEGRGLPDDIKSRVFERFFQGPDQPAGKRGTGIGLAIVTRCVELHGGTVWCEDRPGGGSTFSFTLPRVETP